MTLTLTLSRFSISISHARPWVGRPGVVCSGGVECTDCVLPFDMCAPRWVDCTEAGETGSDMTASRETLFQLATLLLLLERVIISVSSDAAPRTLLLQSS